VSSLSVRQAGGRVSLASMDLSGGGKGEEGGNYDFKA